MQKSLNILFVDDEVRIVNLLRMIFRSDYNVFVATSGGEALEIVKTNRIHVIVSDQRMPEMLGIDLLKQIRQRSPGTMRILLTGYSDLAAIVGSVNEAEVFRFINKPWDQTEIKAIVEEAAKIAMTTGEIATVDVPEIVTVNEPAGQPELLVLDDSADARDTIAQVFSPDYRVHCVSTIEEALKVLELHDVGVIVAEARVGSQNTGSLLHTLKQHYPLITTVILTRLADSDMVINLINQAQIYRFATKPIRTGPLQLAVSAAMREHKRFRSDPRLMARHRVAKTTLPTQDSSLTASISKSLAALRSRFSFFARSADRQ